MFGFGTPPPEFFEVEDYHKIFQNLNQSAIAAVRETAGEGLWRLPDFEGFILLNQLAEKLSEIYNILPARVELHPIESYNPETRTIGLPKISMVSFLHEFRYHMHHQGIIHYEDNPIKDCRGWSISLFRRACPGSFRRSWQAGLISFMPPYSEDETPNGEPEGDESEE